jgi:alpha-ribazole phosphatase
MAEEKKNSRGRDGLTPKGGSPIFVERKSGQSSACWGGSCTATPGQETRSGCATATPTSGQSPDKRLVLVRHARIVESHFGQLIGSTDVALDPAAEAQARTLTGRIMRWTPQICYCSPMQRCRQTAAAIAPMMEPRLDADLREIDFGHFETKTFAEAAAENPVLVDHWAAFNPDFTFPGGECVADFLRRVREAADRLIQTEAKTVLAVSHGGVIRALLCHLLGLEPRHYVAFSVPYATTVVIDLLDGKGVLVGLERPEPVEVLHG